MLTKRLRTIVDLVPEVETVLDVGCDHGLVPYELLKNNKIDKVICSDISKPSLSKAKRLLEIDYPNSKFVVSDGLKDIKDSFDFCIIAGMGGLLISDIIQDRRIDKALLQPMNNIDVLRKELIKLGFKIILDKVIFDEKFYNIIIIEKGKDNLTEKEVIFGRTNLIERHEDFLDYLLDEERKTNKLLNKIPKSSRRYIEVLEYSNLLIKVKNNEN